MGSSKERSAPGRAGIQGARPAPLKAKKDVMRKPPVPPPTQRSSPLIIYVKSPKTIYTKARDFMALVQRLTGKSPPPPPSSSCAMPLSPSSSCFAPVALEGTSTNLGISQEMRLVVDSKPYQMLPPITMPSTPQILQFSSSLMPCPNLPEISSPMVFIPPNSQEMKIPFLSAVPLQRPCASMPLINPTSSFDMDFTTPTDLYSL